MKISEAFGGDYLKASDIKKPVVLTMDRVDMEEIGQGTDKELKPVLYFQRAQKGMVLNKTNAAMIASAYGEETEGWKGQQVILRIEKTQFQGKVVDGMRVHIPRSALPPEPEPEEPQEEEVPF